ncbi:hypothetical protein D9611_005364 [Ephemerocybe angulata]|uniref:Uncharacterized protein n=1 Tax=Ephemerocybe angulata TaxID=980116 RepID=A0A8H5C0B5_9AGAR|nr:hypothetical protein D9611_005364 [Tulosesus angulatus]
MLRYATDTHTHAHRRRSLDRHAPASAPSTVARFPFQRGRPGCDALSLSLLDPSLPLVRPFLRSLSLDPLHLPCAQAIGAQLARVYKSRHAKLGKVNCDSPGNGARVLQDLPPTTRIAHSSRPSDDHSLADRRPIDVLDYAGVPSAKPSSRVQPPSIESRRDGWFRVANPSVVGPAGVETLLKNTPLKPATWSQQPRRRLPDVFKNRVTELDAESIEKPTRSTQNRRQPRPSPATTTTAHAPAHAAFLPNTTSASRSTPPTTTANAPSDDLLAPAPHRDPSTA